MSPSARTRGAAEHSFGKLPAYFVENRGQNAPDVAFHVEGARQHIQFRKHGLTYLLPEASESGRVRRVGLRPTPVGQTRRVDLRFVDANPDTRPVGRGRSNAAFHYYLGSRDQWRESVPAFREIVYRDLWPGIELVYSTAPGELKATLTLQPWADAGRIRFAYQGAEVSLLEDGSLSVETLSGFFHDAAPLAFQEVPGERHEVRVSYDLPPAGNTPANEYGFRLGRYDRSLPLTIDPSVVVYAGYLGGFRDDAGEGIALDSHGAAYIVGTSNSLREGPTQGGPPPTDAFVIKIDAAGTGLAYAVRIGGDEEDRGCDIAVDEEGNAYLAGTTSSTEGSFPLRGGFDMTFAGGFRDAFVLKLDPAGRSSYSSYIGGSQTDDGLGIAVDGVGSAYVSGETRSTEADGFPLAVGPDLTHNGNSDAFVTKINPAGDAVVFSGYLGGDSRETALDIAVDPRGNAYVTGEVFSDETTFPAMVGPGLTFGGGIRDAYVAKVRADGTGFDYVGYIGGASDDFGNGIAVDSAGYAYVTGTTFSIEETFPVKVGPNLILAAANDAFVAKVSPTGVDLIFAGYIGGFGSDVGRGIAIDQHRDVYITGQTLSSEAGFAVLVGPDLTYNGGNGDGFLAKVRSDGTALLQASYIGGLDADVSNAVAVDKQGNAYVAGSTFSTQSQGFPVTDQPSPLWLGGRDAFVAKFTTEMLERPFEVTENGVLNAASSVQFPDPLYPTAPGSIVSIFGHFAWASESAGSVPLPAELAGVTIMFGGIPAPLFAVIRGDDFNPPLGFDQVNAQMPWAVNTANGTVSVVVTHDGMATAPRDVQVAAVSPGVFTFQFGTGPAIVQNLQFQGDDVIDGSIAQAAGSIPGVVTQAAPIGGIIIVFANGLGPVDTPVPDGQPAGTDLRRVTGSIRLFIGGVEAEIIDAAVLHSTLVALNQLNAYVPAVEPGEQVSIQIEANGILSRPDVFIAVRAATK
ncbi:MAG: SBBP repeat-containing protein [Acidobacteria bacterium]|nr:SBBP repeat-containing protein [Acidobacteriota bacterium]